MKCDFINEKDINNIINDAKSVNDIAEINKILDKAENFLGLTPEDVAKLLWCDNDTVWERIFSIAGKIKQEIYGDRIVMFAPIYVSDYCVNNCKYCGFSVKNKFDRKKLTQEELKEEILQLEKMGHKRLALEAGEDPINCDMDYVLECIKTIYGMKTKNGEIRRINVNVAAQSVENFKRLKDADIGTYILFQETYHRPTYEEMHISGPKSNYDFHTLAFDRAMEAGIDDVGGGVLFGLHDYKFEVLSLMLHNKHLEDKFGVGFHTISVPRLCSADGSPLDGYDNLVDDATFNKIVAILRIAVPFTGIIMSTRESKDMRKTLLSLGVSQVSGGSSVEVGGYSKDTKKGKQFEVSDERPISEIAEWLVDEDMIPSFCTACYRSGRTGDRFMQLAKTGNIKNVCLPNALITLKEYALDYSDERLCNKIDNLINNKINDIENEKVRKLTKDNLKKLEQGERDLFL